MIWAEKVEKNEILASILTNQPSLAEKKIDGGKQKTKLKSRHETGTAVHIINPGL